MKDANLRLSNDLTAEAQKAIGALEPSFRNQYLQEQSFSKFVSADTAPAAHRRYAAIYKWLLTEKDNEETNQRLAFVHEEYQILPHVPYADFMDSVRYFIQLVLGEVPPLEVILGSFSGGSTTSRRRTESHPGRKYLGKADVTRRALEYSDTLMGESLLWSELRNGEQFSVVEGNVLFTVPKTTDIDRVACKEPDINMYMQKGVGDYIRRRLRKYGIDLNDQSRNQRLAREGSISGGLATIDLSSASDSISQELVFQSLPIHWYVLLDSLRSPVTIIDGYRHVNEMFSSMGNGFTFELESLLFWAIAKAVAYTTRGKGVISVYGDDIIVPTIIADDLIYALSFLGFKTNKDKTFTSGEFRESCGGHYYAGTDVTPFYIKEPVTSLIDAIHLGNKIRRWSIITGGSILRNDLEELWWLVAAQVPKCFWGGTDLNSTERLVSYEVPDRPKKLVTRKGRERDLGDGGYLLWLDTAEHRSHSTDLGLCTSSEQPELSCYKAIRVYSDARWTGPIFLSEVDVP